MIETFALTHIEDTLIQFETGFDYDLWTTKQIRKYTGLKYQFLHSLWKRGVISYPERKIGGNLVWTPIEVYEMLMQVKNYIRKKIGHYGYYS